MRLFSRFCSIAVLATGLLASQAVLAGTVKLPSSTVNFYADGGDDDAFFEVTLSGVPNGYDVENSLYSAYCVSFFDATSPTGFFHPALLFDTTGALPVDFQAPYWNYINYIINHKQGVADDVQAAIWFFTDGITAGLTPAATAMISDATANGANFVPHAGQLVAVILRATDNSEIQTLILEVPLPTPPAQCDDRVTGGGWIVLSSGEMGNFGVHGGIQNGALWGGLNFIDHGTGMHVHSTATTAYEVVNAKTRRISYDVTIDGVPGTAIVTVTDNGEPGKHDVFQIQLSNGYSEGSTLGSPTKKGGGGNIQLHKAKCKKGKKN